MQSINFGNATVTFLDSIGRPWTPECGEPIFVHRFTLRVDGVVRRDVKSIKFPELSYYGDPTQKVILNIEYLDKQS